MTKPDADKETKSSRRDVQKQITGGAIQFLQGRTKLHQRHHIESDVNQAAMQKHGGHESPPLVLNKKWVRMARSQLKRSRTAHSPQRVQATGFARLPRPNPTPPDNQTVLRQRG